MGNNCQSKRQQAIYDADRYANNPEVHKKKLEQAKAYYRQNREKILQKLKEKKNMEKSNNWWNSLPSEKKCFIVGDIYHDTITSEKEADRIFNEILDADQRFAIYLEYKDFEW